jgi:hypothetical protein
MAKRRLCEKKRGSLAAKLVVEKDAISMARVGSKLRHATSRMLRGLALFAEIAAASLPSAGA